MPRYFKAVDDDTGEIIWCQDMGKNDKGEILLKRIEDEDLLAKLNKNE